MSMSKREKAMSAATLFVLAFGVVVTQLTSRMEAISGKRAEADALAARISLQKELLEAAPFWRERYDKVKDQMPVFEKGRQVDTYWLSVMDRAAEKYDVKIGSRRALAETILSDVFEFPIEVREWEAMLEPFLMFMHEMQTKGAMLNIREMRIQPVPNRPGIMKGSFTLNCAYMRGESQENFTPATSSAAATSSSSASSSVAPDSAASSAEKSATSLDLELEEYFLDD